MGQSDETVEEAGVSCVHLTLPTRQALGKEKGAASQNNEGLLMGSSTKGQTLSTQLYDSVAWPA